MPGLVLETDVDEIVTFHHLFGGLGESRLVPVERRHLRKTGQEEGKRKREQHQRCEAAMPDRPQPARTGPGESLCGLPGSRFAHVKFAC